MHKFLVKSVENDRIFLTCRILDTLSDEGILHNINAIIDTGAMNSAISKKKAKELNLLLLGKTCVHDAARDGITDDYYLDLYINDFVVRKVKVNTMPNHIVDFVLGMDVLGQGCFSFKRVRNEYVFLYRISKGQLLDLNIRNKTLYLHSKIGEVWNDIINLNTVSNEELPIDLYIIHCVDLVLSHIKFSQTTVYRVEIWKEKNLFSCVVFFLRNLLMTSPSVLGINMVSTLQQKLIIEPLIEIGLVRKEYLDESYSTFQYVLSDIGCMFLNHIVDKYGKCEIDNYLLVNKQNMNS